MSGYDTQGGIAGFLGVKPAEDVGEPPRPLLAGWAEERREAKE